MFPVTSRESWNVTIIKLFLDGNTSAWGGFPDQEKKVPVNPEIPEVFLARKSLISDILGFPAGDGGSIINIFNSVESPMTMTE